MKTKNVNAPLYKGVTNVLTEIIEAINYGYEMDCLISSEFTPAPDFHKVKEAAEQLLAKYAASYCDYLQWLIDMVCRNKHPYGATDIYSYVLGTLQYSDEDDDDELVVNMAWNGRMSM
jgi:hypothetical protein